MAYRLQTKALDELFEKLNKGAVSTQGAMKRAVYSGAEVTADAIRKSLQNALQGGSSGELAKSLTIDTMDADGNMVMTRIHFAGTDAETKVPNATKAAVLESGRSDQSGRRKTEFFSSTISSTRAEALKKMEDEFLASLDRKIGE